MEEIRIIHEPSNAEPFIVIDKISGIPSAPLRTGEDSALTRVCEFFPSVKNVHGKKEIEFGLVHRIDTETRGLILIAASQEFYDSIIEIQKENKFEKFYEAKIQFDKDNAEKLEGFPESEFFDLLKKQHKVGVSSFFRPFGIKNSQVRPVTQNSGKAALKKCGNVLYSTSVSIKDDIAECKITNGYRHQVRCHLAWCGIPVLGDRLYNSNYEESEMLNFTAKKICFPDPFSNRIFTFSI